VPFDQALEARASLHFAAPLSFEDDHATPAPRRIDDETPTNPPPAGEPVTLMPWPALGAADAGLDDVADQDSPVPEAAASRVVAREVQDTPLADTLGAALLGSEAVDVVDYISTRAAAAPDAFGNVLDVAVSLRLR
jgi:hypothetical protein